MVNYFKEGVQKESDPLIINLTQNNYGPFNDDFV